MSAKQSCQVCFHCQANVRPIEPRQSSSCSEAVQKSGGDASTTVGRADMAGSNMDITADSCKSLVDQFLQEREPTALAEGGIMAVIDPQDNLMNQFLNEWEPTAPPADGMNMDLLKQLLNVQEPSAPPVMHEKLNRMDMGLQHLHKMLLCKVDFLADLQNVQEPSPLPITCKSSNLRDQSPQPDSLTNLLAQLQDMREPTPPPLVSNMRTMAKPFDFWHAQTIRDEGSFHGNMQCNLFKWNNGDWHLFHDAIKSCAPYMPQHLVWAANAIARELGTAARDQYGAASQGLQLVNMLDLMEVICYPHSTFENCPEPFITSQSHPSHQSVVEMGILYLACQIKVASVHLKQTANIAGWPVHWFANLAMDLNQLNSLILVTVLHASYTPPLPVCYHVYLRHQDDECTFSIINNISTIILHWTPHAADPNSGFAFPWWLYCSEEYAVDSQRLQGKGLFSTAWDFFKLMMAQGLWPLPEAPIADCLDGHIEEQKYANVVNGQG
ncbi:hypothetical protein F5J12DRAFT_782327 [Pisolithus orientalis]|uniref:uncharacterized protein n=1 Tax=Pisolithus orientalis TaxID=936130 RepID=UPI0022256975|nr:uncharacterized protein F5J12DRAFT_782327 [Pisolithus orientalis]KAI6008924.1 hypothetical protein F5J12DRAFT_782327 [Pisolithus orientalis]